MTILNLMLGRGRGGLEQAAVDYAEALAIARIPALTLIAPGAWVEPTLVAARQAHETLIHRGWWDIGAPQRLRRVAQRVQARAILCHGNRALSLALRAFPNSARRPCILPIAHNYSIRRFARADGCFAITQHLADHLKSHGATPLAILPNMVRVGDVAPHPAFRQPPVIGAMGRFVAKKGFRTLIDALAILRARGVAFRAILGGEGEEAEALRRLIDGYGLTAQVTLPGWVSDKRAFFESLDLFVLPSDHEPFGIVLLEAMSQGLPVISADAEGPCEILHPGVDGLLVPKRNAEALANALTTLLADPAQAVRMGTAARTMVATHYAPEAMAKRLQTALAPYI